MSIRKPIVAAITAVTILTGCSGHAQEAPSTPSADSDSRQVVTTYLKAAVGHDCQVTRSLTASSTWAWCDKPRMTAYKGIGSVVKLSAQEAGVALECYPMTVTTRDGQGRGLKEGTRPWTLCFQHTEAGYKLYQQGMR